MYTIAATDLNLAIWRFNTVVWATNGLSICDISLFSFFFHETVKNYKRFGFLTNIMLVGSTNQVFFKAFTLCIPVGVHHTWMQHASWKTKIPAVAAMGRPYHLYLKASGCDFPEWLQSHTRPGDVPILNAKISARIRYCNLAHVSDGCRQKHCIQNCGQKAADRDMVTFNSLKVVVIALQQHRQLLTTYRLAAIHLIRLKRRLRDDIWYPRLNGRL